MIGKNLSRRLERLEAEVLPGEEHVVLIHIHGITPAGERVSSRQFTVRMLSGKMKPKAGNRYRY
jgi:hypothetical protein